MKNLIITFILCVSVAHIQSQSFNGKGDSKANIGIDVYGYGYGIKATYDYGLSDLFTIGAGTSFYLNNNENDFFLYFRSNVHLGIILDLPPQFDIYPGVELGYLSRSDIGLSAYLGLKYYFSKKIGVFAEIGTIGALGLSIDL
jgi:uncharacterized protein DUF6646